MAPLIWKAIVAVTLVVGLGLVLGFGTGVLGL